MSKVLVVCYSYTGSSRRLARLLALQQAWTLTELQEERPRGGLSGTLRCVLDSLFRRQPATRYRGPYLGKFDTVVLVSPIWVGRLAGPMRSFLARHRTELRDVAVVSVMGGSGAPDAAAEVGRILGRTPLLDAAFTNREIEDGSCAARLQAFGSALRDAKAPAPAVRPVLDAA